ncbi:MAG TPA: hypothetical protein VGG41_10400 [Solirubrobacteraceae bacterium]|jgi:hypothetical protein
MSAVRASIGFSGGQVLSVRVDSDALVALREALGGDQRLYDLALEDGSVAIDLTQVAYVRVDSDEPRVGFGA